MFVFALESKCKVFRYFAGALENKDEDKISLEHCLRTKSEFARGLCIEFIIFLERRDKQNSPEFMRCLET